MFARRVAPAENYGLRTDREEFYKSNGLPDVRLNSRPNHESQITRLELMAHAATTVGASRR